MNTSVINDLLIHNVSGRHAHSHYMRNVSLKLYRMFIMINREFALYSLDNQSYYKRLFTNVVSIPTVAGNKTAVYILNDKYHREDGPAVDLPNYKEYYFHGINHRDGDEPAIVSNDLLMYYKNGKQHRDGDEPAIIGRRIKIYLKNDRKHRIGGPAVITPYASEWWEDGVRVR